MKCDGRSLTRMIPREEGPNAASRALKGTVPACMFTGQLEQWGGLRENKGLDDRPASKSRRLTVTGLSSAMLF